MRAAVSDVRPAPERGTAPTPPRVTKPAGSTPPSASTARPASLAALAAGVSPSKTVGKVFFHNPASGTDQECSGSALSSRGGRLVITAGHCVYADNVVMQNWVFVPMYDNGKAPYGKFPAATYRTFDTWRTNTDRERDVAMVTTTTNESGQLLVPTVGGNGLAWNQSFSISATILGYPGAAPYDGTTQESCQGTSRQDDNPGEVIEMQCPLNGGSSGGPWLSGYDNATGMGRVNGVMSTRDVLGFAQSSYFDDQVKSLMDLADND
jgi:V8-like Glu-specific endopeptidase